ARLRLGAGARMRPLLVAGVIAAALVALPPDKGFGDEGDAVALTLVRHFLEARDAGEYRESQRYLSENFGQHFRDTYGAAYLDYMGDPDVTWRQSAAQSSALTPGQCTVEVASMRTAAGSSGAVAETYTLAETYLGWRIDGWRWQAPRSWRPRF